MAGRAAPARLHIASQNLAITGTPYPLPQQVERTPAGTTVGLIGTGLTAMDVIAALTVGRGGQFAGGRYMPSGGEPRIVLANRTGWLPAHGRRRQRTGGRRPPGS